MGRLKVGGQENEKKNIINHSNSNLGSIFLVENTINTRAASGSIELTIFSSGSWNSSLYGVGHSFLMFENFSGSDIYIGDFILQNADSLTIGTSSSFVFNEIWVSADSGITYNKEYYDSVTKGPFNAPSLTITINTSDLTTINNYIDNNDEYHIIYDNCTHFALGLWNLVAPAEKQMIFDIYTEVLISTPSELEANIKYHSDHETSKNVKGTIKLAYISTSTNQLVILIELTSPEIQFLNSSTSSLTFKYTNNSNYDRILIADLSSNPTTDRGVIAPGQSIEVTYDETPNGNPLLSGTSYFTYAKFMTVDYSISGNIVNHYGTTINDNGGGTIEPWSAERYLKS